MTPTMRAKRNSKAPNRFSSGNSLIETSNGETILNHNDNGSSSNMAPISRSTKLKTVVREPLKVKLPKLKRSHIHTTKDITAQSNKDEIKIHKIKLPSLLSKKLKNTAKESGSKGKTKSAKSHDVKQAQQKDNFQISPLLSRAESSKGPSPATIVEADRTTDSHVDSNESSISSQFIASAASISPGGDKSSGGADSSLGSNEADGVSSRMEIVMSQPDSSNGSGIRCPCGVDDDLGVMVECENCSTWQHGHCINVGTEEEAYEGYICAFCALPHDRVRESLCQLTVGDKFQSRFELLESLRGQNLEQHSSCNDTAENDAQLTTEELSQALNDLSRVLNSLKVKWRLLTSSAYEMELRIWQNPLWNDGQREASDDKNSFYFMDRCKSNLKLNIRNMVAKMEDRCRLIDYAILLANSKATENNGDDTVSEDTQLKRARQTLEMVASEVEDFKNKLKILAC